MSVDVPCSFPRILADRCTRILSRPNEEFPVHATVTADQCFGWWLGPNLMSFALKYMARLVPEQSPHVVLSSGCSQWAYQKLLRRLVSEEARSTVSGPAQTVSWSATRAVPVTPTPRRALLLVQQHRQLGVSVVERHPVPTSDRGVVPTTLTDSVHQPVRGRTRRRGAGIISVTHHRGMTPPADTPDLMGHQTRRPLVPTIPSGPLMCIPRRGLHFCGFRRSLPQRPSRRCSPQALITLRKRAHEMNSPWCLNSDLCSVQNHEERWSVNLPAHPISRHTTGLPLLTGANAVPVPEGTPHCRLPSARTAEKMSKAPRKTLRKMPGANRASHPPRKTPTIEPSAIGSTVTRNG